MEVLGGTALGFLYHTGGLNLSARYNYVDFNSVSLTGDYYFLDFSSLLPWEQASWNMGVGGEISLTASVTERYDATTDTHSGVADFYSLLNFRVPLKWTWALTEPVQSEEGEGSSGYGVSLTLAPALGMEMFEYTPGFRFTWMAVLGFYYTL